jgi:hypothetical protein
MAKKMTATAKRVAGRIPPPPPPPVEMRKEALKAFALKVELDMERIQKMIESIIRYNNACSKATEQLSRDLKDNKLKPLFTKKPAARK